MSTILIKDSLRQAVEAASNGQQTVLYTAKGQPTFMNIIEKYDLSTVDAGLSGTHPAFIVDNVVKDVIYVGTYESTLKNGELLSQPNAIATVLQQRPSFSAMSAACGPGFHLMTNSEWSAIALQCLKNGVQPFGNTYFGRSSENAAFTGRRTDGFPVGDLREPASVYTGSGPVEWRHNQKYNGISDLAGNLQTTINGLRFVGNELQVIKNNDAAINPEENWMAIDGRTGAFITPNGTGTTQYSVKFGAMGFTEDYSITTNESIGLFRNFKQGSSVNLVSAAALNVLRVLLMYPLSGYTNYGNDTLRLPAIGATETVYLPRGHYYTGAAGAGIFGSWTLASDTSQTLLISRASRLAYYKP